METVERPWFKASKFLGLCLGIPLAIIGLFTYIYWKNIACLINGFVWLFISMAFLCKAVIEYYKLKKLMYIMMITSIALCSGQNNYFKNYEKRA